MNKSILIVFLFYLSLSKVYSQKSYTPEVTDTLGTPLYIHASNEGETISNAMVIVNNKYVLKVYKKAPYTYILPTTLKGKFSIKVLHEDFPILILDSISPTNHIYLIGENQPYYVENGIKTPYTLGLKYIAIDYYQNRHDSFPPEKAKENLQRMLPSLGLQIAVSFQDTTKKHNLSEKSPLSSDFLKYIFWVEKVNKKEFTTTDTLLLSTLKNNKKIKDVTIPVSEFVFISTSEIVVYYKRKLTPEEENQLIKKYNLTKHPNSKVYERYGEYHYTFNNILAPNKLLENLMKCEAVQSAYPLQIAYTTF